MCVRVEATWATYKPRPLLLEIFPRQRLLVCLCQQKIVEQTSEKYQILVSLPTSSSCGSGRRPHHLDLVSMCYFLVADIQMLQAAAAHALFRQVQCGPEPYELKPTVQLQLRTRRFKVQSDIKKPAVCGTFLTVLRFSIMSLNNKVSS